MDARRTVTERSNDHIQELSNMLARNSHGDMEEGEIEG
jgi:hypothetical protein